MMHFGGNSYAARFATFSSFNSESKLDRVQLVQEALIIKSWGLGALGIGFVHPLSIIFVEGHMICWLCQAFLKVAMSWCPLTTQSFPVIEQGPWQRIEYWICWPSGFHLDRAEGGYIDVRKIWNYELLDDESELGENIQSDVH